MAQINGSQRYADIEALIEERRPEIDSEVFADNQINNNDWMEDDDLGLRAIATNCFFD